jgi:uncharacterized membrane protein YhhN
MPVIVLYEFELTMRDLVIMAIAGLLVLGQLYFEKRESTTGKLLTKTPASFLFVLLALVRPHPLASYAWAMSAGLALCLVGDVFLALPRRRAFMAGLVSFLLGHVAYVVAFLLVARPRLSTLPAAAVLVAASAGVFLWLRPRLGTMKVPVLAYVAVITVMVAAAWSLFLEPGRALEGRVLVLAGAVLFYLSDVTVARDRFVSPGFANRLVGLPVYYAGQFLLALSVAALA